ncbi:rho GTPase activating protein at 5A [Brevipalpus obovatus]|uniref:rho GTPase activating protein at 5A n=1 Tax=Brevipalpus obovatus TaxID=246614 RepID=UPI003D9DCDDA
MIHTAMPITETEENKIASIWKHHLYQLQLRAPKPKRLVCQRDIEDRPPHYGREFHGEISREETDQLLAGEDGRYLVRKSTRAEHQFTLSLRLDNQTRHFRLYYDGKHSVGEKRFDTVHDLVADGLIMMYLENHAGDYIASMNNLTSYEDSPHFTLQRSYKLKRANRLDRDESSRSGGEELVNGIRRISVHEAGKDEVYDDVIDVQSFEKKHVFKSHNFIFGAPFCDYCGNFMWGLLAQGMKCEDCGFNAHRKCSIKVPNDCCPDLKNNRIFGIDLTTIVKACNTVRPFILDICIAELEERGLHFEGIYRVSGLSDDVEALKIALEKDWEKADKTLKACEDVHVITGVLKLYLRSLPIPLISFDAYPHLLNALQKPNSDDKISHLKEAISIHLPQAHYQSLQFLLTHLEKVSREDEVNLMSVHNLSTVLCPTLMRTPNIGLKDLQMNFWDQEIQVLELLIQHHAKIFK